MGCERYPEGIWLTSAQLSWSRLKTRYPLCDKTIPTTTQLPSVQNTFVPKMYVQFLIQDLLKYTACFSDFV
eukprot:m.241739 g.241739  ORF g.241739 m.241739 type:complete len:71 (+) comp33782_c0_seq1:7165-7377(+)